MSKSISDKVNRNASDNTPFSLILEKNLSRRRFMQGSLSAALLSATGLGLAGCGSDSGSDDEATPGGGGETPSKVTLGFESLPNSMTDACVMPAGYVAQVFAPWGTPFNANGRPWDKDGNNTSQDLLYSTGMHHDGMHYFALEGSSVEGLLVMNHEYIDENALHPNGPTIGNDGKRPAEEVRKEINAHGVSVLHVKLNGSKWEIVQNSKYNRRFTSATPMALAGPVAGTDWVKTRYSPAGAMVRGTNNNCGNGYTPWGTYLTAEENWASCFVNTDAANQPAHQKRLGVPTAKGRYLWETAAGDASEVQGEFSRFNITATGADATQDYRNEVNGFGYLVEIDPYDPDSIATKRTAMGRFAHEGAAYGPLEAGKPVAFYTGDDSRFEYIYKFVSEAVWDPKDVERTDRLAVGAKYLDKGTLYVARFNEDGTGEWLSLTEDAKGADGRTLGQEFGSLEAILINTRGAADFVGATPMDRPEWTATHPTNGDIYLTLTNNTARKDETNAANPRLNNVNGHIIRWHDETDSTAFKWDIFVFGANADAEADVNRSGLTELNQLASPDGLGFDDRGILWIQTDNGIDGGRNNAVAKATNDQMLAVVPGALADATGTGPAINADNQGDLRRFFVGPNEAEITGFAFTPDHTTIFLNVQHPVNWPAYDSDDATKAPSGKVRPRASTVAIRREDGQPIGV